MRTRTLVLFSLAALVACDGSNTLDRDTGPSTFGSDDGESGNPTEVTATTGLTGATQATQTSADSSGTTATTEDESTTGEQTDSSSGEPTSASTSTSSPADSSSDSTAGSSSSETTDETGPPPDMVDLSGFTLTQVSTEQSFVLPLGTILDPGQRLVVGRDASRGAFENHWGVVLGEEVVYVNAAGEFPLINGDEVFTLFDPADMLVDGPTPPLDAGQTIQRIDLESSGAAAWPSAAFSSADPGVAFPIETAVHGIFMTEASDAQGSGAFVYEFIELQAWP